MKKIAPYDPASELPGVPPLLDETVEPAPPVDAEVAVAALEAADPEKQVAGPAPAAGEEDRQEGDGPTGRGTAPASEPAVSPAKKQPPKATPRARGDARLSGTQIKDLRKDELVVLLKDREQQLHALRERVEDLAAKNAISASLQSDVIEEAIQETVAGVVDFIGNAAAVKFGDAYRITPEDHAKLDPPYVRLAKLYYGQHAEYSPHAAALLATLNVLADKYFAAQNAKETPAGSLRIAQ